MAGEDSNAYLRRLMREKGLLDDRGDDYSPIGEVLCRFDESRKTAVFRRRVRRKNRSGSQHREDGRRHSAPGVQAENVVDVDAQIVVTAEANTKSLEDRQVTGTANGRVRQSEAHQCQRGKRLQRLGSKKTERTFARVCETRCGACSSLVGVENIRKRCLL